MAQQAIKAIVPILLVSISLWGCATTGGKMGQAATKNFETRTVDAPVDAVFAASTEALFDLGYIIKHSDKQSGLIMGEKRDSKKKEKLATAILLGVGPALLVDAVVYNITIMVRPVDEKSTNVRIKTAIDGEPKLNKKAIDKV